MRLARLDLITYGRFTNASFELPQGERDVHIVFGSNESGKTTSLMAIEDLLFGIQEQSPYNFLHDYQTMRIGAMLENGAERLDFRRRKGRRETILGPDGFPVAGNEGLLGPFLGERAGLFSTACSTSATTVWQKAEGRLSKRKTMSVRCCSPLARAFPIYGSA